MSSQGPQTEPNSVAATGNNGPPLIRRTRKGRHWQLPPGSRAIFRIDNRSVIGREVTKFRTALVQHCGGEPDAVQRQQIELACQLRARLLTMDLRFVELEGEQTELDSRTYLAWANSLSRLLLKIAPQNAKPNGADKPSPLGAYLAGRVAAVPTTPTRRRLLNGHAP
jgi:hypothetical protein